MRTNTQNYKGLKLLVKNEHSPVIISGVPGRLQAQLIVQNTSEQRVNMRSIPVNAPDLFDYEGNPLTLAFIAGRIEAQHQSQLLLDLPVHSTTPPGQYEISFEIGAKVYSANVQIYELLELEIEPDNITIHAGNQLTFEHNYTLTNTGNVPIELGQNHRLPVKPMAQMPTLLREALLETKGLMQNEKKEDSGQIITELLGHLVRFLPGSASLKWEPATLMPAETKQLKAKLELPDNLLPGHQYTVEMQLYGANIQFDVYTFVPNASGKA